MGVKIPLQSSAPHCAQTPGAVQGYHGDTSKMFMVGNVSEKAQDLCKVTKQALDEAVKICGPDVPIREIGKVGHVMGVMHSCLGWFMCYAELQNAKMLYNMCTFCI